LLTLSEYAVPHKHRHAAIILQQEKHYFCYYGISRMKKHLPALFLIIFASCSDEKPATPYYNIDPVKMAATVTITRDVYGIPHIKGPTDESVVFGLAYARAEDHFNLIENVVIGSIGRQSEISGESAVQSDDYQIRAFKVPERSKYEYEQLDNKTKLLCDAYAAGLNYYLKSHPDITLQLITRFEPWHFLAVERMMWGTLGLTQSGLSDNEVSLYINDRRIEPKVGSNMWAISPQKTKNGKTYLVINPHIPADQPYEVHLKSDEGWNFYGLMAYGTNIIPVLGHNASAGWSLTVNYPDVGDAFKLVFDHPADSLKYKFDGEYLTAESWTDSIKIKTDSGVISKKYSFVSTVHGPVLNRQGDTCFSYRSSGVENGGSMPQFYQMSRSENLKQFKKVISKPSLSFHNIMYADKEGNIMYVYNGKVPIRNKSLDWTKPVDGSIRESKWKGYHPLDDLPRMLNPGTGYLQNCNSSPFFTTARGNPDADDFPDYMTSQQPETDRAKRSRVILDSMKNINLHSLENAIMDTYVHRAEQILPELFKEYDSLVKVDNPRALLIKQPVETLRKWNRMASVTSKEATLYFILDELLDGDASTAQWSKISCFERTIALLQKDKGTWEIAWGDIMRHQRVKNNDQYEITDSLVHYPLPGGPGNTGIMYCVWPGKLQDKVTRRSAGGHSYVAVVEFGEQVKAESIIPYGNSSDPNSPHYTDQAKLFAEGKFKAVLFTDEEIDAKIESRYHPGEKRALQKK
jgi:acyl-homoserine-lactone acylase